TTDWKQAKSGMTMSWRNRQHFNYGWGTLQLTAIGSSLSIAPCLAQEVPDHGPGFGTGRGSSGYTSGRRSLQNRHASRNFRTRERSQRTTTTSCATPACLRTRPHGSATNDPPQNVVGPSRPTRFTAATNTLLHTAWPTWAEVHISRQLPSSSSLRSSTSPI